MDTKSFISVVVKSMLFLICCGFFLRALSTQLTEFVMRKSYLSSTIEYVKEGVRAPIITVCPVPAVYNRSTEMEELMNLIVRPANFNTFSRYDGSRVKEYMEKTMTGCNGMCLKYEDKRLKSEHIMDIFCFKRSPATSPHQ